MTDEGRTCQRWTDNFPHEHSFHEDKHFPLDGSAEAAENFCRNMNGVIRPWCYTTDPLVPWEECVERICRGR